MPFKKICSSPQAARHISFHRLSRSFLLLNLFAFVSLHFSFSFFLSTAFQSQHLVQSFLSLLLHCFPSHHPFQVSPSSLLFCLNFHSEKTEVNFAGYLSAHKRPPSPEPQSMRTRKEQRDDKKKSLDEMHFSEVLKLRGLPYSATKADIVKFFGEEFDLKEADINICCRVNGKATGEAFAKFSSAEMAKKVMNRDKMPIGSRYVELFASTAEERCRASSKCA